jgi:hypothetical protein
MIETLARLGYASKALIYAIVGSLALAAALNRGGRITDTRGALRVLLTQPLGNTLLWIVAIGLCGYALWRVLDAVFDPDGRGTSLVGMAVRAGSLLRGGAYGTIGLEAFRLARGLRGSSSGRTSEQTRLWTARVMDHPFGDWLVALVGLGVIAYGIWEIVKTAREKTEKSVDPAALPGSVREPLINIARFGVMARAVVIVVLGLYLARAALQHDPSKAIGPREGIIELVGLFGSRWVLAVMGLGLIAYGVDQAIHARARRIRSPI